jgi:hypothetical protein
MSMKEKLRRVQSAICVNRREMAHTRLEERGRVLTINVPLIWKVLEIIFF